jgi:glycosyltransferase involved in cell wall biosynthesis
MILKEQLRPSILIAGDLKRGLIASLLLKSLYGFHLRIQASIHGIPFAFRDEDSRRIHDFIPWIYLRITLPFVDSIRIVSVHLRETMRESFGIPNAKVFIAPIPIIQKPDQLDKLKKPIHIGIIGRLHPERGIDELIRILSICLAEFPDTRVTFYGTGEMFNNVNKWKLENLQFQNISLKGHVAPSKLLEEWPQITHILSTAPSEGYGLTLREALLSGSVVIAKANQGTRELKNKFVSGIYLYAKEQDACEILIRILHGENNYTYCADAHFLQEEIDSSSMDLLAKSWMH